MTSRGDALHARLIIAAAVLVGSAIALAGCSASATSSESGEVVATPSGTAVSAPAMTPASSKAPSAAPSAGPGAGMSACEVTDDVGLDGNGLNATAWQGVLRAADQLGVEANLLEPGSDAAYAETIQAFIDQGCTVIVTVGSAFGGTLADATRDAANAHPDIPFSIVDHAFADGEITNNNVLGQAFKADEAALLAGYLAAGMTKTGTVATFGGRNIPQVTMVMEAFYDGVQRYNADNGAKVDVLGWNPDEPGKSLFTGTFDRIADGRSFAGAFVDQGADILMPVAGRTGLGSAALATTLGPGKLAIIGADTDQYVSDAANRSVYLTSVMKNADVTTFDAIASVVDGSFDGGVTEGTLSNGGVGLAPYHDFDALVPQSLKDQIDALKAGIIDGSVDVRAG